MKRYALVVLLLACGGSDGSRGKPDSGNEIPPGLFGGSNSVVSLGDGGPKDGDVQSAGYDAATSDTGGTGGSHAGMDASAGDAGLDAAADAGPSVGYTDAGLPYVKDGDQCDECTADADCTADYVCRDWYSSKRCFQLIPKDGGVCSFDHIGKTVDPSTDPNYYFCIPYTGGASGGPITCDEWRMLTGDYD